MLNLALIPCVTTLHGVQPKKLICMHINKSRYDKEVKNIFFFLFKAIYKVCKEIQHCESETNSHTSIKLTIPFSCATFNKFK